MGRLKDTEHMPLRPVVRRLSLAVRGIELGPLDDEERADIIALMAEGENLEDPIYVYAERLFAEDAKFL